ncbi:MAG: hypothetical protein JWM80_6568 [Cyanobacteria bacterium RYN_339]|nr:hypothetical protein [Cyanobacteria bacterium RYN_339]
MSVRSTLASSFALVALGACVYTPPAPPPPQQTIVAQAPANVPGVPGVPSGTAQGKLSTTAANVTLALGAERVMNDVLRDQTGLAPTSGVLWLSSNAAIVTVNPLTGQARGVAPGTAVLTASLQSAPSVQTQVTITVNASGKAAQIRIEPANPELAIGEGVKLVAKVQLADGTISSNVDWTSSDNTVAVVNGTTGEVNALKVGTVTIKGAYSQDPSQFSVSSVTVVKTHAASPTPTPAPTATPAPAATGTPTPAPTASATATPTPSPTATPSPTPKPTATP